MTSRSNSCSTCCKATSYLPDSSLFIMDDSLQVILHRELIPFYRRNDFSPGQKFDFNSTIRDKRTRQIVAALKAGIFSEKFFRFDGKRELVFTYRQKSTGWHVVLTLEFRKTVRQYPQGRHGRLSR